MTGPGHPGRPKIGVSACLMHADPERAIFKGKTLQYTEEKMAATLWRGGGLPFSLPDLKSTEAVEALVAEMDGLLLQGGADVSPTSYGETPLRPEWGGDRIRDEAARALFAELEPDRRIVQLDIDQIAEGGGGIHCCTMQIPA